MDRKTDRFPIFYFWIVFPIIYNHISLKSDFQKIKRSFFSSERFGRFIVFFRPKFACRSKLERIALKNTSKS